MITPNIVVEYQMKKPERIELFNFKTEECQKMFYNKTEFSNSLLECLQNAKHLQTQACEHLKVTFSSASKRLVANMSQKKEK